MSSRPLLKPKAVISAGDMSADVTSLATEINQISKVSYTVYWTGSPTGTFSVQVSNDYVPSKNGVSYPPENSGHWVDLVLSATVAATGSADSAFIDVETSGAAWIRLFYDRASGTGVLNATVAGKVA